MEIRPYLPQQAVALAGCWVIGFGIALPLGFAGLLSQFWAGAVANVGLVVAPLVLGYLLSAEFKGGATAGRWMWVAPAITYLLLVFWTDFQFGWKETVVEFFNPEGGEEKGLGFMLFSVPLISSALYSLGAFARELYTRLSTAPTATRPDSSHPEHYLQ